MTLTAGTHRSTGKLLTEVAHIQQCIGDILSTPLGSRVMREDYGSLLPELIDQPQGAELDLRLAAATYMALVRWEPRITPTRLTMSPMDGKASREIEIIATLTEGTNAGASIVLRAPISAGALAA